MATNLGEAKGTITIDASGVIKGIDKANAAIDKADEGMKKFGLSWNKIGITAAAILASMVAAAIEQIKKAIEVGSEFEVAMAQVSRQSLATLTGSGGNANLAI
jgi:hypothetical protein